MTLQYADAHISGRGLERHRVADGVQVGVACAEALQRFPEDRDFQAMLDRVREKGRALLAALKDRHAERFFLLAENLKNEGGREASLSEILDYMQAKFPDSPWTREALALRPGTQRE